MKTPLCVAAAVALALVGCKKKEEPTAPPPAVKRGDGGAPHWAELLLGKGRGDISSGGFGSYSKCIKAMERQLPPELGVVLPDHYDVPDAICRMRQALAEDNPDLCRKANTHTLRKGCAAAYAIHRRKPELCPLSYSRGRDAECVALASRNPVLCLGARYEDGEVACRAILEGDIEDCRRLTRKRERCEAQVRRWKPMVKGGAPQGTGFPKGFEPTLTLSLSSPAGRSLPAKKLQLDCAGAGAVVPSHGNTEHVVVCEYYSSRHRYRRGSYLYAHRVRLDFGFRPPANDTDVIRFGQDAHLRMRISGGGTYESTGQGEVRVKTLERRRGGRLSGTFKVTVVGTSSRRGMLAEAEELEVQGSFDTFVRDLVDPSKLRRGRRYGSRRGTGTLGSLRSGKGAAGLLGTLRGLRGGSNPAERTRRFAALLTAARVTRVSVGQHHGLQLTSIVKDSLWERLGLLEGDVVFQVGTVKLARRADVTRIRGELRGKDRVVIRLRRGKRNTTLTLTRPAIRDIRAEFTL